MVEVERLAGEASIIVNGYAFIKFENGYKAVNLNRTNRVSVIH